jgi:hypothetical protein
MVSYQIFILRKLTSCSVWNGLANRTLFICFSALPSSALVAVSATLSPVHTLMGVSTFISCYLFTAHVVGNINMSFLERCFWYVAGLYVAFLGYHRTTL